MDVMDVNERIREAKAKYDLIGGIHNSEIFELLGLHRVESLREKELWNHFMSVLSKLSKESGERAEDISELAVAYGNEREEIGFRCGFHVAMRICMEGLNRL